MKKPKQLGKKVLIDLGKGPSYPGAGSAHPKGKTPAHLKNHLFQPGNTEGRKSAKSPRRSKLLSEAYKAHLEDTAPDDHCLALGMPSGSTWSDVIAAGVGLRAAYSDTTAARELREVTEGRLPETFNFEGHIDYTAGLSAKELLLKKLGAKKD